MVLISALAAFGNADQNLGYSRCETCTSAVASSIAARRMISARNSSVKRSTICEIKAYLHLEKVTPQQSDLAKLAVAIFGIESSPGKPYISQTHRGPLG